MLKVTIHDGRIERTLVLEGKLIGPWVPEFESVWKRARESCQGCDLVIDLSATTAIDASGKAALMAMAGEGARLTGKGVYTEHLVKGLQDRARHDALHPAARSTATVALSILGSAERLSNESGSESGETKTG